VMNVNKIVSNPTLLYQLDPGEPGLLKSAKANKSYLQVSAQERRNLNRLESEARMEGRRIIFSDIKYFYGRDGSYSTIRAGETTVVSVTTEKKEVQTLEKPDDKVKNTTKEVDEENIEPVYKEDENDIENDIRDLELEKSRIENKLKETGKEENKTKAYRELNELQEEIDKLKQEKIRLNLEEQQETVNSALIDNSQSADNLSFIRAAAVNSNFYGLLKGAITDIRG